MLYGQNRVSCSVGGVRKSGLRRSTNSTHDTPSLVIDGTLVVNSLPKI